MAEGSSHTEYRVVNEFGSVMWTGKENVTPYLFDQTRFKIEKRNVLTVVEYSEWEPYNPVL